MSQVMHGLVASLLSPHVRRTLALAIAAGATVAVVHHRAAAPPVQSTLPAPPVCELGPPIAEPPIAEPPAVAEAPVPGDEVWAALGACLAHNATDGFHVTVEQVRAWVEVDHDPAWREGEAWWLPVSGEGEPDMPSGRYAIVTPGKACSWAIVN